MSSGKLKHSILGLKSHVKNKYVWIFNMKFFFIEIYDTIYIRKELKPNDLSISFYSVVLFWKHVSYRKSLNKNQNIFDFYESGLKCCLYSRIPS